MLFLHYQCINIINYFF